MLLLWKTHDGSQRHIVTGLHATSPYGAQEGEKSPHCQIEFSSDGHLSVGIVLVRCSPHPCLRDMRYHLLRHTGKQGSLPPIPISAPTSFQPPGHEIHPQLCPPADLYLLPPQGFAPAGFLLRSTPTQCPAALEIFLRTALGCCHPVHLEPAPGKPGNWTARLW